ncbi:MAG: response regulator transcription factor [Anaerolineales bacterium]|nr:response regulator transcription factor [Anaerolineales bacterium]
MESILIVDDDSNLLQILQEYLEFKQYRVITAQRGQEALRLFYQERPDLIILDVMMPGMDGWEVCARIREMSDAPIIMLTAKTDEADKLRGFRLGVDDYVTKPFSNAELAARVSAILVRTTAQRAEDVMTFRVGDLEVDMRRREARLHARQLGLTPTEFRVLAALARRSGEAVSRQELIEEVWGDYRKEGGSALRRYIWFLRKKIERDPKRPLRLATVRGYGYRLEG